MNETESNFFNKRRTIYCTNCSLTNKIFIDRLKTAISLANISQKSKILDVGCNDAELFKIIRQTNMSCKCWGIDIWDKILQLKIPNCKFQIEDIRNLPFEDRSFDIVFTLDVLEHVQNVQKGISEIFRVLKPGGVLILSGPTESWFYKICRILLYNILDRKVLQKKTKISGEADYHYCSVYDLEEELQNAGFKKMELKVLPGFPLPSLFRIVKYKK